MKKNLFLLPSIILIFFLCFTTLSCFSGFLEEKGQVTLTFSESSLHNLMARGAVSEEAENDFDFLSDFPNKPKIEYQFYGFEGQFTDIEDFDEEDFDLANAYVLNFYEDSAYEVYSAALLSELAKEQEGMFDNVSEEDIFKNPDFQEMLKDPSAFYEKAIVSKGNWSQSGNLISISETYFYDLQTGSLSQSASPKAMTISLDSPGFYISSQSGVSLTFFNESVIDLLDDDVENSDDKQNTEETTESQENSDKNLSIVVTLTAGDKNYEKTIDVKETDLHGSKSISFNNLTVGLNAKVTIVVYEVQSDGKQTEYAKGESNDFVIQSGNNPTTIKIKKVVTDEKEPEVKPKPDPDPEPDPQDKEEEIVLPSGTIVNCYGGQLKDSTTQVANYILALYENKQYAVYEFSDEFLADESNKEKYSFEGVKDISGIIAVVSRMLENGTVISFGTYTYSVNEYDAYEFKYSEQYYYDKESKTYKASKYGGTSNGALSVEELNFGSQSGTRIVFFPFRSITINDVMPSFNIEIKGFDKNDVTDIDDDYCIVNLYEIKDQTDMTRLKTAYGAETLTDIQRAKILIPVIKNSMETKIARFNPNAADDKNNQDKVEISVDDDGVIHWTGKPYVSNKVGDSYGILATVFFSHRDGLDFYEFDFGYVDNLQIKSGTNDVQLTVKGMNIPCKIKFNYDDNMSDKYQVDTAISDIVMADADGSVRGSVVNEILSAIEETNEALEKEGYEFDNVKTPLCGMEDDIPTVIVFYRPPTASEQEEEKDPFEASGGGSIITDNRAVEISMDYDVNALGLNNGQFTFTAKDSNGTDVTSDITDWSIQLLYKGENVNQIGDDPYYETAGNKLSLFSHIPLPFATNYQIFVTAKLPVYQNSTETVNSSQTFDIEIPDRHFYTIRDPDTPWNLSGLCVTGVRNVVINGDVKDADWGWNYFDQNADEDSLSENLLWVLFTKNRASLESLTFNGEFTSPDYNASTQSTTYSPFSTMTNLYSFMKPVSLKFNNKAHIGNELFHGVNNLKEVRFTTSNSSIGDRAFRNCIKLDTVLLTGVSEIGQAAFGDLEKLAEITIPASVTTIGEEAFINPSATGGLAKVTFEVTTGWKKVLGTGTDETLEAWEPDFTNITNIAALLRSAQPTMPKLIRE